MTKTEAIRRVDMNLNDYNNDVDASGIRMLIQEIYDDFKSESLMDNGLLPITYEAGRQAGKDSMKSEIAKAYMEGGDAMKESMEELL